MDKHPERDQMEGVEFVSVDDLFRRSDYLTLHAPLTPDNKHVVDLDRIRLMKPEAMLINTGRGDLIQETDLRHALNKKLIAAAALDVLSAEPPSKDHELIGLDNCILTPHNAWATRDARARLIKIVAENIRAYLSGNPRNVVNI